MEGRALDAEERSLRSQTKEQALENAILAADIYMKALKLASSTSERDRLRSKCMKTLARAEKIKQTEVWSALVQQEGTRAIPSPPLSERVLPTSEHVVLLEGSRLHGFIFPPWESEPDEDFFSESGNGLYVDNSTLKLSKSQQDIFAGWKRPCEIFRDRRMPSGVFKAAIEPTMIAGREIDLVQDLTADCSVVASLCAVVARSGTPFERALCTIFYPYDKVNYRPMISKNGRYALRFNFNGCCRKVVIDDCLPESRSSRTIHVVDRQNPGLLWPALVEKAYLKVRGGYDFQGSNSGTDLWVLTGWIPEQVSLQSDETDPEDLWHRIFQSNRFGDVIVTLGTGRLSRGEEEALGLAGEHDYAVLKVKETDSRRLLLVKNPWCDGVIWKGSIPAAPDSQMLAGNAGEINSAETTQLSGLPRGTFWIGFDEVIRDFESLYLNWNPELFRYRQDHHFLWEIPTLTLPSCFTYNPQYLIKSLHSGPVWALLSRHFSTEEREIISSSSSTKASRSPLGFIGLYIFDTNGRKVHLGEHALLRGPFVDSPQTLIRLDTIPLKCYTLVIAQQDLPLPKYSFTLSVFSRQPLTVSHALNPHSHSQSLLGAWTTRTAGGNASSPSYPSNPQFRIRVPSPMDITLLLEATQLEVPIHVTMVWGEGERATNVTARDVLGKSGEYRRGFAMAEISQVSPGLYTIICSTFEQGQTGNFNLRVETTAPCEVRPIAGEAAGRLSLVLPKLLLRHTVDRILAPMIVSRMTRVRILARTCDSSRARSPIKITLELGQGLNKQILASSCNGEFSDAPAGIRITDVDVGPKTAGREGFWLVVERIGRSDSIDEIEVEVLSEALVEVGAWGTGDG